MLELNCEFILNGQRVEIEAREDYVVLAKERADGSGDGSRISLDLAEWVRIKDLLEAVGFGERP